MDHGLHMDQTLGTPAPLHAERCRGKVVPVILSGGTGTRLWPVSRESFPKQLWPLISDHSLIQETALRAPSGPGFTAPIVVCNQEHRFLIAEQLAGPPGLRRARASSSSRSGRNSGAGDHGRRPAGGAKMTRAR